MKLNKSRFQQAARFELLPLIDVIFLLLIFFIFVMLKMTMQSNIKVDLPQLVESKQQTEESIMISINANNKIFINEQDIDIQELTEKMLQLAEGTHKPILIRGDQQSDLGIALNILDKLRQAGFEKVAFATENNK
ncbi:ExbD/TolR family protein [Psychromonas sp. PT13]|uniref:ExbD/TolR family protein n=1 Tax=Psychromonas sp. PT13 TaxID=3439547 RepID=UPI003EBC9299